MRLFYEVLRLALSTIRENKVRAFLTILGVIIGTGTIIGVGSILAGLDGAVTGTIRSLGSNTAIVFKMQLGAGFNGRTPEERQRKPITYENAVDIQARCPDVEHVSPYLMPPQQTGGGIKKPATRATPTPTRRCSAPTPITRIAARWTCAPAGSSRITKMSIAFPWR